MVLMAFMAIPVVMAQTAPPCTVVGVVTLNSTPVDDAIITCNGTTTSTHDGGLYTIDVQPGDNIIYATFTNSTRTYTGDTGLFYVSSGDYVSADIELSLYTPTPTPGFGSGDGSNFNLLNGYSMGFIHA
jgi:co-chaperonin GroES (HSP10)